MAIGTTITLEGAKLLAKALGGKELKFTRGAFGDAIQDGVMKTPTVAERDALTALIHEKMSLPITGYEIVGDQIIVSLDVKNESVTEDFRIAEMGLFAKDPDSGQEKLYAYTFQGNDGDKMYAANTDVQLEFQVELVTKICGAENVTAVITRTYDGLTREDLEEHINSTAPHPNWDVVLTNTFNAHSLSSDPHPNWEVVLLPAFNDHINSANPHPNFKIKAGTGLKKSGNTISLAVASAQSLGGVKVGKNLYMDGDSLNAESSELDVDGRLKQLEINQANLYILLEALNKFGVQGNLIMTEDFQTLKYTNRDSANVTIAAEGKDFKVDDISFMRPTSAVVVTNGLAFNKLVTVDSIKSESGEYILTADSKLNETTSRGKLYRSSVTIRDNKAYGAGLMKTKKQSANMTWKGEGSSDSQTLAFNAYPSLESSFALDGDWSLTSDGYFTLD